MKKLIAGVLAISFVALIACHRHGGPEQRADWITGKISRELDLNDAQEAKLETVKQAFLENMKQHKGERSQSLDKVKQMISGDRLEAAQVKSLMAQRQKMMDESFDKVFGKVADFHASLTPEQKKKAVELIEKFESKWE